MAFDVSRAFALGWKYAHVVPDPLLRAAFTLGADVAWARRGPAVVQLERNLRRVCPDLDVRRIRRLSKQGMRSYMRYFREIFTMTGMPADQVAARVRVVGEENVRPLLTGPTSPVLAMSHQGNWDLAGAYASAFLAPVMTVAERLEPDELFHQFVVFRNSIGMEVLALGDAGVFRDLMRTVRGPGRIIPLLADRDLTARGVEVDMFGHRARVAAGPAALAVSTGAPVVPLACYYERLTGERRRHAGSPWGLVLNFLPAIPVPEGLPRAEQVSQVTQGWVDALASQIASHPQDWHMLQKVFVSDLDPARYARTVARSEAAS